MPQPSFKCSDEMLRRIEAEAKRKEKTISDVIRNAVEYYFTQDVRQQNLELLLYEIVKTRAVVVRTAAVDTGEMEVLCEAAGEDAKAYLEERKKP